jgi:WD40 repeat protein
VGVVGLEPGQTRLELGDYVLVEQIGSGGSGTVHRAWQRSLERFVAIKLVEGGSAADAERFQREARTAARLTHPHIVPIYEVGAHEGRQFLVMRLIDGQSMDRVRVDHRRAIALMCQAINAISYAHKSGVVHRDLKPHNLILERGGEHVWVTDFGIARPLAGSATLTAPGNVIGTPAYMPPEQARGGRCDERSDVYSLGATLYELITGRSPFDDADLITLITRVLSTEPPPARRIDPTVAADVEVIIGKAMAKDPAHRYPSARELEEDLRRYLAGEPIRARPPSLIRLTTAAIRRHPVVTSAIAFSLALVGALAVTGFLHTLRVKGQLAENMVAEANALGAAGQWEDARARYREAATALQRLGLPSVGPELGLLDAEHQAPPPLLSLRGHTGPVRAMAFLPDGRRALSASDDGTLRLWDVLLGRTLRALTAHEGPVIAVAVAADGKHALSGGQDGTLRYWDLDGVAAPVVLQAQGGPVWKVALSPDGRHALSRTAGGVVELWDLVEGRVKRTLSVASKRVLAVAFSPDGRYALTPRNVENRGENLNSRASLWEVDTGKEVQTVGAFDSEIESVAFSPDGHRLLTGGYDRLVSLWDLDTGRRLLALKGHRHGLMGVAFSPQNRVIISGGQDQAVKLWDATEGKLVRSFETGDDILGMAVSSDGRFILTGGDDGTLSLWDLTVGQEARSFSGHVSAVLSAAVAADGQLAFSGGQDHKVRVWDAATGQEIRSLDYGSSVHAIAASRDGHLVAAGGTGTKILLWDLHAGGPPRELVGNVGAIRGLDFSPDGRHLLSGSERGEVKVWEVARGVEEHSWNQGREVRSVAFGDDGRRVMAANFGGTARIWDAVTGQLVRELQPIPVERIGAVAMSRDGRYAATGNDTRLIRLWDLATGKQLRILAGHLGDVRAVRFSADGGLVLSASRDGTLRVWDTASGRALHAFSWLPDDIRSFAASPDGRFAIAGNEEGALAVWDFDQVRQQAVLEPVLAGARAVLDRDPQDARALATLGAWYALRGVTGWAAELLRRAEAGGAPISALMLARCLSREGDLPGARRELERALTRGEAPADYLRLLIRDLGSSDQAARLTQLNAKDGRVRFSFLGIRTDARRLAEGAREAHPAGALVSHVFANTPADQAGIRRGDLILAIDGQPVNEDSTLGAYLISHPAGTGVKLTFLRDGLTRTVGTVLAERPGRLWERDADTVVEPAGGYTLQTLRSPVAQAFGLDPATQGVVVVEAGIHLPHGIAGRLLPEDVIVKIDGKPVATAAQAAAALALPPAGWNHLDLIRPGPVR